MPDVIELLYNMYLAKGTFCNCAYLALRAVLWNKSFKHRLTDR